MSIAHVLLLVLAAGSCRAQFPDLSRVPGLGMLPGGIGDMIGSMSNNPEAMATMSKCASAATKEQEAMSTCTKEAAAAISSKSCPESCKKFLNSLTPECLTLFESVLGSTTTPDASGKHVSTVKTLTKFCGATDTPTPSTPSTNVSPPPHTNIRPKPPTNDSGPIYSKDTYNFTCETDNFTWVTLNATLASASAGNATTALNSTCQDLNTTGCCTEVTGNNSWVQYGLGAPMMVRGIKVVAPDGECASNSGTVPCNQKLLNVMVHVSNTSMADFLADVETEYAETFTALANYTNASALASIKEAYAYSLMMVNNTAGLCNWISPRNMFANRLNGVMVNNGTLSIGCLGAIAGNRTLNSTVPGFNSTTLGGNVGAAGEPLGSYLTLSRYLKDDGLALCGIQVCAKPLNTTAEPLNTTAKPLNTTAKPLNTTG